MSRYYYNYRIDHVDGNNLLDGHHTVIISDLRAV